MKFKIPPLAEVKRKLRTIRHLNMLPLYLFLAATLLFAGGRRLAALVMPVEEDEIHADCESICNQFEVCIARLVTPAVVAQYRWIVQSGCRNGCYKQRDKLGECFENHPSCDQAQACIFGHLKENM